MKKTSTTDLALVAAFAALIAVCAILPAIYVTGPVPITLQTFAVLLSGAALGPRRGALAAVLYLVVGAAGLPVFAGGKAGLAVFAGPTAGYLFSYPVAALVTGALVALFPRRGAATAVLVFAAAFAGVVVNHAMGVVGLMWRADMTFAAAWKVDVVFWLGDTLKAVAVAVVATAVHRAFPGLLRRKAAPRATVPA